MVHGNKKQPGRNTPGSNNNSLENQHQQQQHHHHHHHQTTVSGAQPPATGTPSSSSLEGGAGGGGGSGNNNNTSARQTGTVPKTKASRKNSVPQEIVAPTRRDLQQHLTELVHWASTAPSPTNSTSHTSGQQQPNHHQQQQNGVGATLSSSSAAAAASKQRNIRTPGEGTCFDLDNLSLQDHSRFIPVRPIVRGSYLSEDFNSEHLPHTTIGVVIPTTPSQQQQHRQQEEDGHHQQQQRNDPIWQHIINPPPSRPSISAVGGTGSSGDSRSFRIIPDGAPSQPTSSRHLTSSRTSSSHRSGVNSAANRQLDDRILEIQDYIRATSTLINTINQEKIVIDDKMVNEHLNGGPPINSINLETLANSGSESELNGPRPQSVASIHSTPTPGTPDYEELQQKLQSSSRNMDMIREQQNQIIRLQQAAKAQLEDMEQERLQNATSNLLTQDGPPNYESVGEVQDDVSSLMNRMRTLTTFVDNQNELANMLGGELLSDELLAEQAMLTQKVEDLKSKRGQMADLVSELQSMNTQADLSFSGGDGAASAPEPPNRNIPINLERIVPIEMYSQDNGHPLQSGGNSGASLNSEATLMNCNDLESEVDNNDSELYDTESLVSGQNNSVVAEKLAEINAMKDQLKRLQNMMSTVKLIENKVNGPDPVEMARATEEVDRLINEIPAPRRNVSMVAEKPQPEPPRTPTLIDSSELEPILSERVQQLHAMTADLRVQALSLAAERDRLRVIKDEMIRRKAEEQEEKASEISNGSTIRESAAGAASLNYQNNNQNVDRSRAASEQRKLKDEFEAKKREYETVLEKMREVVGRQSQPRQVDFMTQNSVHSENNDSASNGLSKKMQNDQMGAFGGAGPQSPAINLTPWRRAPSVVSSPLVSGASGMQVPTQQNMSATIAQLQEQQTMFQQGGLTGGQQQQQGGHGYSSQEQGMFSGGTAGMDGGNYRGDSLLLQQFIQTQQMLINSISQCNQLLWAQQRELNNLNNAVLMLQERLLKHELCNAGDNSLNMSGGQNLMGHHPHHHQQRDNTLMNNNRAESVPPASIQGLLQTANGNTSNLMHQSAALNNPLSYMRAQSEQPQQFFGGHAATSSANFGNAPQTPLSPVSIYPMYNNQTMLRNGQQQQQQQQQQHQMQAKALNNMTNNLSNNRIARVTGNVQIPHHMQGGGSVGGQGGGGGAEHHLFGNNILNLNPLTNNANNLSANTNLDHLPPIHHHFGGPPHHPNMPSHMLNNQVAPGTRANNYWDNFRSYSRQNLLSGNTCKSNEDSCASSSSNYQQSFIPVNQQQQQQPREAAAAAAASSSSFTIHPNQHQQQLHQSRIQQVLFGKGFQQHCRNTIMDMHQQQQQQQQNSATAPPGFVLNNLCRNNNNLLWDNLQQLGGDLHHVTQPQPQQQQQQHHDGAHGTSFPPTNMTLAADILGFHTNPINLGVNAEFAAKSKTLPKGNKKRSRQMTTNNSDPPLAMPSTSRGQIHDDADEEEEANLNLASATSTNVRSKSTSNKFFEALKENVRCEVSNLIETNDLRPYLMRTSCDRMRSTCDLMRCEPHAILCEPHAILFRDLQLMSSSDPTRHQTLQSIQNMYNRYVESTIQEEAMFGGGGGGVAGARVDLPESPLDDEERLNLSSDEIDNRMLVNDLRMEAKTENDLATQNREAARRKDNQAEDSLRRQNKRRYRNRVNEIVNKQNFLVFPTSSGSSHSTPVRSVNDLIPVTVNIDGNGSSAGRRQVTSSSDSSSISISTDCEIIRIVMQEIAEYLQSIEPLNAITEPVVQRIGTIIISHLNNSMNERLLLTNFRRIDREQLMVQLRSFAGRRNKLLRRVEQYLMGRFVETAEMQQRQPECLTGGVSSSVERDVIGGENQEVLQKAQKKQNNDNKGRNSVIVQQQQETTDEEEEDDDDQVDIAVEGAGAVARTEDLLQMESTNDNSGDGAQDDQEKEERERGQVEQIWMTDEEVEILSTNDGPPN